MANTALDLNDYALSGLTLGDVMLPDDGDGSGSDALFAKQKEPRLTARAVPSPCDHCEYNELCGMAEIACQRFAVFVAGRYGLRWQDIEPMAPTPDWYRQAYRNNISELGMDLARLLESNAWPAK